MSNIIKIKRGLSSNISNISLQEGEIACTTDDGGLYIGTSSGNKQIANDYNELINKPQINNIELIGNKTLDELGIQPKGDYALTSDIPTSTSDLENDSGFITNETDPTVPSYVKSITQQNITSWNNKQDLLTAGENITIENNVISATTGGGGEVPVYIVTWKDSSSSAKETWTKIYQATLNKEPFAIYLYYNNRYISCTMVVGKDFIFSSFTENTGRSYGVSTATHWKFQLRLTVNDSNEVTNIYYIEHSFWEIPREAKALGVSNTSSYTPTANYHPSTKLYTDKTHYENMAGYDASKTQVLKNVQGVLTWVDEV